MHSNKRIILLVLTICDIALASEMIEGEYYSKKSMRSELLGL
jgi:hypothetical protein